MVSEEASITNGRGGQSNVDGAQPGNQVVRGRNKAPCSCGCPPLNKNAHRNASNLTNPSPSQGGNAENAKVNGDMDNRINQIATTIT